MNKEQNKKEIIYAFIDGNNLYQGLLTDLPTRKYK